MWTLLMLISSMQKDKLILTLSLPPSLDSPNPRIQYNDNGELNALITHVHVHHCYQSMSVGNVRIISRVQTTFR